MSTELWDWADVAALAVLAEERFHKYGPPNPVRDVLRRLRSSTLGSMHWAIARALREAYEAGNEAGWREGMNSCPEPVCCGPGRNW